MPLGTGGLARNRRGLGSDGENLELSISTAFLPASEKPHAGQDLSMRAQQANGTTLPVPKSEAVAVSPPWTRQCLQTEASTPRWTHSHQHQGDGAGDQQAQDYPGKRSFAAVILF